MKNSLLLLTALALTLAGCKLMETRPSTQPGGSAPEPPAPQVITDRVPAVPNSSYIVVGLCRETGAYAAMGVDTMGHKFTFLFTGSRATQQQAFQQFYAAGVPVTVYTQTTMLRSTESGALGMGYNPCLDFTSGASHMAADTVVAQVAEDPPPTPKPTGGEMDNLHAFGELSWRTAFSLSTVEGPKALAY